MDKLAGDYAEQAHHLFIYTRETHPEHARGLYEHFTSYEEKVQRTKVLQERHNTPRVILVDSLDGDVHRAYAGVPNQSWVIDHAGRIAYKASWTTASEVRWALEGALTMREAKREGGTIYYREFFSHRQSSRTKEESQKLAREGHL